MLKLSHINARSICNKIPSLHHSICENNIDICAVSKTWIKQDDDHTQRELAPPGYKVLSYPLSDGWVGGRVWPSYWKITLRSQIHHKTTFSCWIKLEMLKQSKIILKSLTSFCWHPYWSRFIRSLRNVRLNKILERTYQDGAGVGLVD